jgi:multimeric flavodoxin WrbA
MAKEVGAIFGGSRQDGNSRALGEAVLAGIDAERVYLYDLEIPPIDDRRHDPAGFGPIDPVYADRLERIIDAPIWVLVSPVYWYALPSNVKAFIDLFSQVMRLSEWRFLERTARKQLYLVLAGGDNPRLKALGLITQLYWTADFLGWQLGGYVLGEGNRPQEVLNDTAALQQARVLNAQIRGS